MNRPTLLTFDLDDTLWPVETVIRHANQVQYRWLADHVPGFRERFPPAELLALAREEATRHPELQDFVTRKRRHLLRRVLEESGVPAADIEPLARQAFEVFYAARQQVNFFPGVLETLQELAGDYRLWAVSNGNADIFRTAAGPYFTGSLSAEACGHAKPHPRIFHLALEHAGVDAGAAIHIGDHQETDVAGAMQAGLQAIWVNRDGESWPDRLPRPHAEIAGISDLPALLAHWNR